MSATRRSSPRGKADAATPSPPGIAGPTVRACEASPLDDEDDHLDLPRDGILDGRYRVVDRVGDGGMGIVLRVHDQRLDREVALKIMRPSLTRDLELVEQFLAEARAMAQLRHPNVVEIYDFGQFERLPYFVMRFIDGPDLHRWVERQATPLPIDVALGVLGQVCDGVAAIHDAGVVHRDIKPENMLVDESFRVVVTDFGLVRRVGDCVGDHQVSGGTAAFMAPELARAEAPPPDPRLAARADVYALGIMAYWLLVGRHPFEAETRQQMLDLQVRARVPPPSEMRPDLPRVLDPVVLEALHKDPRQRTANARLLVDQLRIARQKIGRRTARIVIVDEDVECLRWAQQVLGEGLPDAEIVALDDSSHALALIERSPPSLVITGLENEGCSGMELAATMRGNPVTQQVPVLVLSAVGGAAEWQALWAMGVQGFLLKPLTREMFVPMVRGLLPRPTLTTGGLATRKTGSWTRR